MQCKACGSDVGEVRSGFSKKNNKPWKGFKCGECGEMTFMKTEPQQQSRPAQQVQSKATNGKPRIEMMTSYCKDLAIACITAHGSDMAQGSALYDFWLDKIQLGADYLENGGKHNAEIAF